MNKKGNMMVGMTVTLILTILVVTVLFSFIGNQTDATAVSLDQFSGSNLTCVQVTDNCIVSTTTMKNATDGLNVKGNFTLCASTTAGDLDGYLNTADVASLQGATINASYTEASCERITGTNATIIGFIPLLLAVAIIAFVAFFVK